MNGNIGLTLSDISIIMPADDCSLSSSNNAEDNNTMSLGFRKSSRSKTRSKKSAPSTVKTSSSASSNGHPYLDNREKVAIERWNERVPRKSETPETASDEQGPLIQAYLEAKLSLFRNAGATNIQQSRDEANYYVTSSTRS